MLDTVRGNHIVEITDVEWSISAQGQLTQLVCFDTLRQGILTLSKVPILDARRFKEQGSGVGAVIEIQNAKFKKIVQPNNITDNAPQCCPFCGSPLDYQVDTPMRGRLVCRNPYCEGALAKAIEYYANHVGIPIAESLSGYVAKALPHKALYDLYDFTYEEWEQITLVGEYKIGEIVDGIEASRNRLDLETFLHALAIPMVSLDAAHEIAKQVDGSWEYFIQRIIHRHQWEGFDVDYGVNWGLYDWFQNKKTLTDLLAERINFVPYAWDVEDIIEKEFKIYGNTRYFESQAALRRDIMQLGGQTPKFDDGEPDYIISNLIWRPESSEADELYHYCLYHPSVPVMDEGEYIERTRNLREGATR